MFRAAAFQIVPPLENLADNLGFAPSATPNDTAHRSLIDELNEAVSSGGDAHRQRILERITDLFAAGSRGYNGDQIALFDDVLQELVADIEVQARARLAQRLAHIQTSPPGIIRALAFDDSIVVAEPVLKYSQQLSDADLAENARTKSQEHLLAIAQRLKLSETVTDVLVDRGDRMVVMTLAANDGAKFSEAGHSALVERARDDQQLALAVLCRPDISRPQMLALVERASAVVRQQLIAEGALKVQEIADVVREASRRLRTGSQITSEGYVRARERVGELQRTSGLSETVLLGFIHEARFEEVVVTLSEMSGLAATDLERMLVEMAHDRLMIVARALGLSWNVVSELVVMNQPQRKTPEAMERLRLRYLSIPPQTATRTLRFHQLRTRAQDGAA